MLFTIVFDEVGTLDTTDIKTAFQACGQTQLVSAVLNAETKEVLYGELPDWMLSPEEAKVKAEKKSWQESVHGPINRLVMHSKSLDLSANLKSAVSLVQTSLLSHGIARQKQASNMSMQSAHA